MRRVFPALVAASLGVWATSTAWALDVEGRDVNGRAIVFVSGEFKYGDATRFGRTLARFDRIDEVWFSSPGGNVTAALEIGRLLRKSGLATRVPSGAICASACAYAFIGGVFRAVDPKGRVGVHNSSVSDDDELMEELSRLIRRHGAEGARELVIMVEKAAAEMAAAQGRFLLEMSVSSDLMKPITSTDYREMHWLSRRELVRYNVVNE